MEGALCSLWGCDLQCGEGSRAPAPPVFPSRTVDGGQAALGKHFGIMGVLERICQNFCCPQTERENQRIVEWFGKDLRDHPGDHALEHRIIQS